MRETVLNLICDLKLGAISETSFQAGQKQLYFAQPPAYWPCSLMGRQAAGFILLSGTGEYVMSDDLFERRQTERRYALNFLDYEVLSDSGDVLGRGMARTLNVSETGLRLETSQFFEPGQRLRLTLSLDNDLVQVDGRVVNSQPENDDLCTSGVMFMEFEQADRHTYQKHFEALKRVLEP